VTMMDLVAWVASEGVSIGFAHCVPGLCAVPTQAVGIVNAKIAAFAAHKTVILLMINRC
jgi:hypothetical protein